MISLQKPASRASEKKDKQAKFAKNMRAVYRAVDQREGFCCRVCGKRCNPAALDMLSKGHHHHIVFRSKQGATDTANVLLLCAICHSDVHAHRLAISGNADKKLAISRMAVRA